MMLLIVGSARAGGGHRPAGVVLVGHSMGGSTVTRVANAVPELLARMVQR